MLATALTTPSSLLDSDAWYTELPDTGFLLCSGADSSRFLQGQLSCDLQKLDTNRSLRGALNNIKGRVIVDLALMADSHGILLLVQQQMCEKLLGTLNKYRVFFKTSLEPVQGQLLAAGIGGTDSKRLSALIGMPLPSETDDCVSRDGLRLVRLSHSALSRAPRYLCIVDTAVAAAVQVFEQIRQQLPELPQDLWRLADIRDGQAHPVLAQSELFTPQLLNYDLNGVIDFKKGCYTGQEIIARMHYRAEAKRRLYHLKSVSADEFRQQTQELSAEDIVSSLVLADGSVESLVVAGIKQAETGAGFSAFF